MADKDQAKFKIVFFLTDNEGYDVDGWRWQKQTVSNNTPIDSLYEHPAIAVLLNPIYEKYEIDNMLIWKGVAENPIGNGFGRFKTTRFAIIDKVETPSISDFKRIVFALYCVRCSFPVKWLIYVINKLLIYVMQPKDNIHKYRSSVRKILPSLACFDDDLVRMIDSIFDVWEQFCLGIYSYEGKIDFYKRIAETIEASICVALKYQYHTNISELWKETEKLHD